MWFSHQWFTFKYVLGDGMLVGVLPSVAADVENIYECRVLPWVRPVLHLTLTQVVDTGDNSFQLVLLTYKLTSRSP